MEHLRNNESVADKQLEYNGHTFSLHSKTICIRCPLLFTKWDRLNTYKISTSTVVLLLQYIYTGRIKLQKTTAQQLMELVLCSIEFSLPNLEILCCHYLQSINEPNFILQIASSSSIVQKSRRVYRTLAQKIAELKVENLNQSHR
jgi:hypothetical protein